jgi:hypothetical protein
LPPPVRGAGVAWAGKTFSMSSMSRHQASNKVWGTVLDDQGVFRSIDME